MLKSYAVKLSFLCLFLSVFAVDQSTKLHAQKAFMNYSSPTSPNDYSASSHRVFTLGESPLSIAQKAQQAPLSPDTPKLEPTKHWLNFEMTYLRNHGAIWGIMSENPTTGKLVLFYVMTFIAILGVFYLYKKSTSQQVLYQCALVFVLAGALGNFFDRILLQYVIDWIHFSWRIFGWEYSFPVFNVADISIDVGIGLMLLDSILNPDPKTVKSSGTTQNPETPASHSQNQFIKA